LAVAEARHVVLIAAEVLLLGRPVGLISGVWGWEGRGGRTDLSLKEQNCWLMTCQTISSDAMATALESVGRRKFVVQFAEEKAAVVKF
jgi:hypothetical protein